MLISYNELTCHHDSSRCQVCHCRCHLNELNRRGFFNGKGRKREKGRNNSTYLHIWIMHSAFGLKHKILHSLQNRHNITCFFSSSPFPPPSPARPPPRWDAIHSVMSLAPRWPRGRWEHHEHVVFKEEVEEGRNVFVRTEWVSVVTCATIDALWQFDILNVQGRLTVFSYYCALEYLTDNPGLSGHLVGVFITVLPAPLLTISQDLLLSFMLIVREYWHTKIMFACHLLPC